MALPVVVSGEVVRGFGRGGAQLGCPTANLERRCVDALPTGLAAGVYCAWASVDGGAPRKAVANLGWCPFYGNAAKSLETHVLAEFERDLYGRTLRVALVDYLREEREFASTDELAAAIRADKAAADRRLDDLRRFALPPYFPSPDDES